MARNVFEVRLDQRDLDAIEKLARGITEEMREEVERSADAIPRATLGDLLGFDVVDRTPTWDAIFQAVDDLMEVRRG